MEKEGKTCGRRIDLEDDDDDAFPSMSFFGRILIISQSFPGSSSLVMLETDARGQGQKRGRDLHEGLLDHRTYNLGNNGDYVLYIRYKHYKTRIFFRDRDMSVWYR